jgi:DNA-binding protein H-NS
MQKTGIVECPMSFDLEALSRLELLELQRDLEKALKQAEVRERQEARKAAEKAAAEFGFSLDEITGTPTPTTAKRAKSAPKYRNPMNHDETWTGRGRKPKWVHEALTAGHDISELEI